MGKLRKCERHCDLVGVVPMLGFVFADEHERGLVDGQLDNA